MSGVSALAQTYLEEMQLAVSVREAIGGADGPAKQQALTIIARAERAAMRVEVEWNDMHESGAVKKVHADFKSARLSAEAKGKTLRYDSFALGVKRGLMATFCAEVKRRAAGF